MRSNPAQALHKTSLYVGSPGVVFVQAVETEQDMEVDRAVSLAEARVTLGVVAARQGDLDEAISQGGRALSGQRKSLPSLLLASRDLTRVLNERFPSESGTKLYLDQLHVLTEASKLLA
jgi:hypothetical protein